MSKPTVDRLPLTLLTGFLGAGKTTFLNRYLKTDAGAGTAVLVNEFGDVDVDGAIIGASVGSNRLLNLPNGCVCCEVQDDLAEALVELCDRQHAEGLDRCVIETTGLANPGSILRGVAHDPRLKTRVKVVQTICVASAPSIRDQAEEFVEAAEQITLADRIVVSKSDLLEKDPSEVLAYLGNRAQLAEIALGTSDVAALFAPPETARPVPHADTHKHTHGIATFSVDLAGTIDRDLFRDILSFWIMRHAERLLRAKGILRFANETDMHLVNITHDVCEIEPFGQTAPARIVFIGIDLPEDDIRSDLTRCLQP
ncbi:CobW family GTP-binding protein [Pseudaestuariivita atlantica]|uniref:CobW family GTP-binding protein n=1 Tax=Pseudaestuariivita atlantica TaxID=1317121 RepID=UPI001A94BAD2|nr:GTP-binding protein [Pseudaestuariivita atlantica]